MKKQYILVLLICLSIFLNCEGDDAPNEPVNTPPEISTQSFDVSEAVSDTDNLARVVATDADNDQLVFSIKTNSEGLFQIADDGNIRLIQGESLDFETTTTHTLSIDVSDGTETANADITINVIDVDENTSPSIAPQTFSIEENSANSSLVGTIIATDAENDNLTYSTSSINAEFAVSPQGEITVTDVLNFEVTNSYQLDVMVSDGVLSANALITINITDINDAPLFSSTTVSITVAEDITDSDQIATLTATDEDQDAIAYSIDNDTDDLFSINSAGVITLQATKSLDFETTTAHTFTIIASDPDGAFTEANVTLNVMDVVEPQVITVSTAAGSGVSGSADGTGQTATFARPSGVAIAANGDAYIADENNAAIRKISVDGIVSTFAGGVGTDLAKPVDLVFDSQGNLFVSDQDAFKVFKIDPSGNVTTFAGSTRGFLDGTGVNAQLGRISGIGIDDADNLYVADGSVNRIRKITPAAVVTTIIGDNSRGNIDGPLASARFREPQDITVDKDGNIYLVDSNNFSIRKVTPSGIVSTLAGSTAGFADGVGAAAQFRTIRYITIDGEGNLYTADGVGNYRIRKITPDGTVTTLAGNGAPNVRDGDVPDASFRNPLGIDVTEDGRTFYVTEFATNQVRKITVTN